MYRNNSLHSALKTTIIQEISEQGVHFKQVRLQHGKADFTETLHVRPSSWSTSGLQSTDLLSMMGFDRSACAFHNGECYAKMISESLDVAGFAKSFTVALKHLQKAATHLETCGIQVPQPEGWGFFYGKPSTNDGAARAYASGDGHVAPKVERLKESEDEYFRFILTWIDGAGAKGWTTHYRAKHMPLSPEFSAALDFLGQFSVFSECPEFDFEPCWWRFTAFQQDGTGFFGRNTEYVHRWFDAHASNFSLGLKSLLAAHVELQSYGLSFLKTSAPSRPMVSRKKLPQPRHVVAEPMAVGGHELNDFDVAISFAGTEREQARQLAEALQSAGFKVFYDDFYPEQLWGKDLVVLFDRIYRKSSKYCVMFISKEYANRIWTTHERRSAQARALKERGREYILPIRVDDTDLDGLPPTVGYLPLGQYPINEIAELLIKKLGDN